MTKYNLILEIESSLDLEQAKQMIREWIIKTPLDVIQFKIERLNNKSVEEKE